MAPFVMGSYITHTPEDYHRYFHHKGVRAVVRLNNQVSLASPLSSNCMRCCGDHATPTMPLEYCLAAAVLGGFMQPSERL